VANEWTVVLSGPLAQRAPLLASLKRAGVEVSDQPKSGGSHGLPNDDRKVGWITGLTDDIETAVALAGNAGWSLLMHWPTPKCRGCNGLGKRASGPVCLQCKGAGRANNKKRDALAQPVVKVG
jgi:hypothetical protein